MDKRLTQALDFSNYRMILSTRQENLKILMENKMVISYEGGLFKIDQQLLSFIRCLIEQDVKQYIFLDHNDIPILITNLEEFYTKLAMKYETNLKQYYDSYQKLSEAREIRKVIDWDEQ